MEIKTARFKRPGGQKKRLAHMRVYPESATVENHFSDGSSEPHEFANSSEVLAHVKRNLPAVKEGEAIEP